MKMKFECYGIRGPRNEILFKLSISTEHRILIIYLSLIVIQRHLLGFFPFFLDFFFVVRLIVLALPQLRRYHVGRLLPHMITPGC